MNPVGRAPRERFPWTFGILGFLRDVARRVRGMVRHARDRLRREWVALRARPGAVRRLRRLAFGGLAATALFAAALHLWAEVWSESTWIADTGFALRSQWNRFATASVDFRSFAPVRALIMDDVLEEMRRRGIAPGSDTAERELWRVERNLADRYLEAAAESDRLEMFKYAATRGRPLARDFMRISPDSWMLLKLMEGDSHPLTRFTEGLFFLQLMGGTRANGSYSRSGTNFFGDRARIPAILDRIRAMPGTVPDAAARIKICMTLLSIPMDGFDVDALLRRLEPIGAEARVAEPVLRALATHDATSAVELIRAAADDGCLEARVAMGDLHAEGLFLPYDPDAADRWYASADAPGHPAKRAERDPARTPVATFRAPLEEPPFGVLRFSGDETEVVAASGTRIARFSVADPSRARIFLTLPIVALAETGDRAITRTDGELVLLDARSGDVTGTVEVPACLRGGSLHGRFHADGKNAWITGAGIGNFRDGQVALSGGLIDLERRRFARLDNGFIRTTSQVSIAIRPDLGGIGLIRHRRSPIIEFLGLPPDADGTSFERIYPERHLDEKYGGRERGWGWPTSRLHAVEAGRFVVFYGTERKGTHRCYDWYHIDPERCRVKPSPYVGKTYISNEFEVVRNDGEWAFFAGYLENYGWDGHLRDLTTLRVVGAFPHPRLGVRAAAFSGSGKSLATTDGYLVKVWDLTRFAGYTLPEPR